MAYSTRCTCEICNEVVEIDFSRTTEYCMPVCGHTFHPVCRVTMLESLGLTGNVCPACVEGGDGAQEQTPLGSPGTPESLRELALKNGPVAQEATAKEDATDPQESSEEDDSDTDADATAEAKAEASIAESASRKS